MNNILIRIFNTAFPLLLALLFVVAPGDFTAVAQQRAKTEKARQSSSGKGKTANKTGAKKNTKKSNNTKKKKKQSAQPARTESSADVRRREEAARQEVRRTEAELRENEKSVKASLADLSRIEGDISVSRKEIATISSQVKSLDGRILGLEGSIASGEAELSRLRDEYMKAVRKMRSSRKKSSGLAFIFASESFNQALRRMRYLGQFADWKEKRTAEINGRIATLKDQRARLSQARTDRGVALKRQQSVQTRLEGQKRQQDAVVADLRRNGEALRSHLARKQAEVNQLRNRVAELIALEERRAAEERERREAEERRRREAEERRIAEEKASAERRAAEAARAEEERLLAAQRRAEAEAEEAARQAAELKAAAEKAKADKKKEADLRAAAAKKEAAEKKARADKAKAEKKAAEERAKAAREAERLAEKQKKEKARAQEKTAENASSDKSYAEARRRRPRSESGAQAGSSAAASGFESMKGRLPRPVSGAFRITSRFGRQSLPDMPDVVYDNPGIDAEVSEGASAAAVFAGTVAGVYVVPGFNNVVIVRHGSYYTVYGNIVSPSVKSGDAVKQGQKLGRLGPDSDSGKNGMIHFEVWKNRTKLDPSAWIQ